MRFYEFALIASPEITDKGYDDLLEKIDGILKKKRKKAEKGEILHVDDWGVRKLSYPINKTSKGRYAFLSLKCLPDTLSEIERSLRLMDDVFRFQTVKLKEEPKFEAPVKAEVEKEPVAEEAAGEAKPEAASGKKSEAAVEEEK